MWRNRSFSSLISSSSSSLKSLPTWIDSKGRLHPLKEEFLHLNTRVKKKWIDLISWNILGPNQGNNDQYSLYSTLDATVWRRREERIINYLLLLRPTIICLQELSYDSITSPHFQKLAEVGYVCAAFAPSSTDESAISHSIIGCGIFVQQEKIEVISSHKISLSEFAPLMNCKIDEYSHWIKNKPQAMAVCKMTLKATNQRFLLANTRLCSNQNDPDVRAIQTQSIINSLSTLLKKEVDQETNLITPIVLCGDFTTEPVLKEDVVLHPDLQSRFVNHKLTAPFHILTKGSLPCDHPEHPDMWSKRIKRTQSPDLGIFMTRHPKLIMTNTFQLEPFCEHHPLWTTKTHRFQGWVDHIWVNSDVKVRRVLSPLVKAMDPQAKQIDSSISLLPTKNYPSDHIPVGCVISFPSPSELIDQTQESQTTTNTEITNKIVRSEEEEIS